MSTFIKRSRAAGTPLSQAMEKITKPLFKKRGFVESRLITEWPQIVGAQMAAHCSPEKLVFDRWNQTGAKLHLVTESSWALELQHMEPVLLEKIAGFFGFKAVERLVIRQGQLPQKSVPRVRSVADAQAIANTTLPAAIQDDELRLALQRLAHARNRSPKA